jgi:hypothetical protein
LKESEAMQFLIRTIGNVKTFMLMATGEIPLSLLTDEQKKELSRAGFRRRSFLSAKYVIPKWNPSTYWKIIPTVLRRDMLYEVMKNSYPSLSKDMITPEALAMEDVQDAILEILYNLEIKEAKGLLIVKSQDGLNISALLTLAANSFPVEGANEIYPLWVYSFYGGRITLWRTKETNEQNELIEELSGLIYEDKNKALKLIKGYIEHEF